MHLLLHYPDQTRPTPLEYAEFLLCREMGWTFEELEEQPAHRVREAFLFLEEEGKARKWHQK